MIEPVYFAVVSRQGVESPRLFYERIPPDLLRKESPLIYATRLDTMDGCDRVLQEPLHRLFHFFVLLRKAGKLPPEDRGPKPLAAKRETTISREHWAPPPVPWDQDAPAYPPLQGMNNAKP